MSTPTYPLDGDAYRAISTRAVIDRLHPGSFARMPYLARVMAENVLRKHDPTDGAEFLRQVVDGRSESDVPFYPARVVLQDLLGTPALVDLAGLRDAVAESGVAPQRVNPVIPTQLVVDHSLNVEVAGTVSEARKLNEAIEQRKNAERFEFLRWAKTAFRNLEIVMPGNGILHQINLERLSPVVHVAEGLSFLDTLVGTDSHTTMINALGVVGWGVGGIEAESVMLGRPIWMRMPQIVGVELVGQRQPGVQATDLVLALTEYLRGQGVVGSVLEFFGPGVPALGLADRATISNMAPEFGATSALFAIDDKTLDFLRLTGRHPAQVRLVEAYAKTQGLWASTLSQVMYPRTLHFDLGSVGRAIAGPANPHQRIPLNALSAAGLTTSRSPSNPPASGDVLSDGAVVIAAITSCTNTSNPRNLIAAGLFARNALARGLQRKPWVKTSFAPGSKVVESYLAAANLLEPLADLGFGIVGFGCTSCNGMSGPLPEAIEQEIVRRDLHAAAVLSGNRNFNGRIHPRVKEAYLASPALTVAYALAGTLRIDIAHEPLGNDAAGKPVLLDELWPDDSAVDALLASSIRGEQFTEVYDALFQPTRDPVEALDVPARFAWGHDSTYIKRPPYWSEKLNTPPRGQHMRAIAVLGDNITTDDLSPSGAILPESAAGAFLIHQGIRPDDFNSYGTRRGNHLVGVRATLANNRLHNEMVPGVEGSFTRLEPGGTILSIYDCATRYVERGQELVVIAGANYGCGSSRDWAAKGIRLLGVRAVICESFERIHRTNLVGMGVLPLEFFPGTTRKTLEIDGSETFSIVGLTRAPAPGAKLTLRIQRQGGSEIDVPVKCRIDTSEEVQVFAAGGLLPRIRDEILAA